MVSTRSSSRRKPRTRPAEPEDITDQVQNEQSRTCSETIPIKLSASFSPLWSPVGNIKKIHTSSPILKAAKRDHRIPEFQHHASTLISSLKKVSKTPVKDPLPNVSTGSHCWSGSSRSNHSPYTLDDLDMELVSKIVHETVPKIVSDQEGPLIAPVKSTTSHVGRTSQCTSLNITELARRHQDDMDDDLDEVQSAIDPAFVIVNGHKVKKEYGPLLCAMFHKYADLTRECEGKPPAIVALYLERACVIYERLKVMKFSQAKNKDLKEMLVEVQFLESQKLNLSWLREKLQYICDTKMSFRDYLAAKEERKRSDDVISKIKNELSLLEKQLAAEMAKSDEITKRAHAIRARVDGLWTHSLVHGLL